MADKTQHTPAPRALEGIIVKHGSGVYPGDENKRENYFINLKTSGGERQVWGVDLKRVAEENALKAGDAISLERAGVTPVEIENPIKDDAGTITGFEKIEGQRAAWKMERIDPAKLVAPTAPEPKTPRTARKAATVSSTIQQTALAPQAGEEAQDAPSFQFKFSRRGDAAATEFPLSATRLEEAKAQAFERLAGLDEQTDHVEILQSGKVICTCDFDHEKGTWGAWTRPRRDFHELPASDAEKAAWQAQEAKSRAADEKRKAGLKPGAGEALAAPSPSFSGLAVARQSTPHPPAGAHAEGRILGFLPPALQQQMRDAAAAEAKKSAAKITKAAEKSAAAPAAKTVDMKQFEVQPIDQQREHERHQTAQREQQRQADAQRERQG